MTRWLPAVVALLALATVQNPPPRDAAGEKPPPGTGAISGVVTIAGADETPARSARVTLSGPVSQTTTTDERGRFLFRALPPGRYTVRARKPAYLTAAYGARWYGEEPTPIPLGDGETSEPALRLVRGGVVTGTVRDEHGRPMPGVPVSVLRFAYDYATGERTLRPYGDGGNRRTDDRGEYRIWALPPGEYVVVAAPSFVQSAFNASDFEIQTADQIDRLLASARAGTPIVAPPPGREPRPTGALANFAPIFHPGVTELSLASRIRLGAGEERAGVDIALRLVRTARIRGTVTLPAGVPAQAVTIELSAAGADGLMLAGTAASRTKTRSARPDGAFEIADVAPGTYRVMATTGMRSGRGAAPLKAAPMWAMAEVRVDGDDVPLALELTPALTIRGRVVFDGTSAPLDPSILSFRLVPPGSGGNLGGGPQGGTVSKDGMFSFGGVIPNVYRLLHLWATTDVPGSWSLRSATVNGRDILDAGIVIRADGGEQEIVISFTDRPTELSGVFQDASGRPTTDYLVIIFPADRAAWVPGARRLRTARPAIDGSFLIHGLPPGDYLLAALADLEPGLWNDPEFLASVAPAAIPVSLAEGEKKRQDIRVR